MQPRLFLEETGRYRVVLKESPSGKTFFVTRASGRKHPCECFFLPSFEYLDRLKEKVRFSSDWYELVGRKAVDEVFAATGVKIEEIEGDELERELHLLKGYPIVHVGFTSRYALPNAPSLNRDDLRDIHELAAELLGRKDPKLLEVVGGYDNFSRFVRRRLQGESDVSRVKIKLTAIKDALSRWWRSENKKEKRRGRV